MANVIIKSDERKAKEAFVLKSFGRDEKTANAEQRECAAQIAYETQKVIKNGGRANDYQGN